MGYCIHDGRVEDSTSSKIILVYEYTSNGNFRASIRKSFKMVERLGVLIGVVKDVHFLHTRVILTSSDNRLKTNNILLDDYQISILSKYGMSVI
ncbi:Protein kinase, catalytic domain-containing protein [Cynara cardunculus var. scolymus]|uniref:Protein kinase, catalytic domain-containing protein n=1 Tax=Cynara cardunculus var. scolymus TaxID=59895 RepID=A0A103Y678_CYNCS|nr:Protein kinase, catalytic domain-containing protein [Cynara cardunculus var. scolymus]